MTAVISMSGGCVPPTSTQPGGATVARSMRPPDSNGRAVLSHFATLDRAPGRLRESERAPGSGLNAPDRPARQGDQLRRAARANRLKAARSGP